MPLSSILELSRQALEKITKRGIIAYFLKLRNAYVSEIGKKDEEIKRLSQKVKELQETIDKGKQKGINRTSNQPSSKKPEWDKDGNVKKKTDREKGQKKRKKRKGSGNKRKTKITPSITNHNHLDECPHCGEDLSDQPVTEETSRIVEDIPDPPEETFICKEVQERKWCKNCNKIVTSKTENALPKSDIGLNTTIMIAYFWVVNALSLPNIKRFLKSFMKLTLSTAGISQIVIRLSSILQPVYDEILEDIKSGCAIWADETGWRVKGKLLWLWIFANKYSAYYWPDKSRGSPVVEQTLGKIFSGVLITDAWHAYKKIICSKQTCMAHIFRKIRKFIDAYPEYHSVLQFYLKLRRIIRDGVTLQEMRRAVDAVVFQRRLHRLKQRLEKLLMWENPNQILHDVIMKVRRQQEFILTFVEYEYIPCHNNYGEYIIRKGVLKRKISGGSMSVDGARAYACLQSIAQTCHLRNISFFDFLKKTLLQYIRTGKPLLFHEYENQFIRETEKANQNNSLCELF